MENQPSQTNGKIHDFFFQTPIFEDRQNTQGRGQGDQSFITDDNDDKFNKTVISLIKFLKFMKKPQYSSHQHQREENEYPLEQKLIANQSSQGINRKASQTKKETLNNNLISDSSMESEQNSKKGKLMLKSWENHKFYGLANQVKKNIFGRKRQIKLKNGCYGQIQLAYYIYYDQNEFYAPDPVLYFHKQRQKYSSL